jgi:acetyl-CoA C-acetyltransferase
MTDPVYVVGAYEHPTREAPEKSTAQLHAEVAAGALDDAGLQPGASTTR